jgi:cytochrome c biogenesis protein CcmG, thiol:disulfide interchange protein DsbE
VADPVKPRASNTPYLIASVLAAVVILAAWLGRDRIQPVGPGAAAPPFEAVARDGAPVTLDAFTDRVVLLNVWATWCPPCRYEMPSMQRLYDEFEGEPFEIVAVSLDAEAGEVGLLGRMGRDPWAYADSLSLTFPILHDPAGRVFRSYRMSGVPESFLIGRDGTIYRKVSGATEWDRPEYVSFIRSLIEAES